MEIVNYLVAHGADPNMKERHPMGVSALFKAAIFGHEAIVAALLKAGALVNEQGPANGMTPLHDAVLRGRTKVVSLLLKSGADPKIEDYTGRTPIDLAKGNPELSEIFKI